MPNNNNVVQKAANKVSNANKSVGKRPVRDYIDENINVAPNGPLGYTGHGKVVGALAYFISATANKFNPVPGTDLGYRVVNHTIDRKDGYEMHHFVVDSWVKDTSKFAAKFDAPPSTVDFFRQHTEITNVETVTERRTSSTWKIDVKVENRSVKNP